MNEWIWCPAWRVGKEVLRGKQVLPPPPGGAISSLISAPRLHSPHSQGFLPRHYTGFFAYSESSLPRCRDREKGSWRDRQRIWLALSGLWVCFPLSQRPTPFPRRWDQVQQTRRGAGDDSWEDEPGLNSHKVDFIILFIISLLVPRAWLSTHEPLSKYLQPHL